MVGLRVGTTAAVLAARTVGCLASLMALEMAEMTVELTVGSKAGH